MRQSSRILLVLTVFALLTVHIYLPNASSHLSGYSVSYGSRVTASYYYFDYLYTVSTLSERREAFDTPINYSDGTLNQSVRYLKLGGNLVHTDAGLIYDSFNGSYSYVVAIVNQSWINYTSDVLAMLKDPKAFPYADSEIPNYVRQNYIGKPADIVVNVVKKDFEEWLNSFFGLTPANLSKASLAARAAYFIYRSGYITYNASAVPRPLNYVVTHHTGDCDDMSRVLLNLLWAYGIPGKIEYSLVYLRNFSMTSLQSFGSSVKFVNTGPHAYVATYVPQLGWVSLDLLAGARLYFPSIILGSNEEAIVTQEESQEARESLLKERFAEEVMIYDMKNTPENLLKALNTNTTALTNELYTLAKPLITSVLTKQKCIENITVTKTVIKTIPIILTKTETQTLTKTVTETITRKETTTRTINHTITATTTKTRTIPITYTHTLTSIINNTKTVSKILTKTITVTKQQTTQGNPTTNEKVNMIIITALAVALIVGLIITLRRKGM